MHCLHECSSNPHFAHCPKGSAVSVSSVPHWAQRDTECVPVMCTGRGPNVSLRTGFSEAAGFSRSPPLSWYPCWRYLGDKNRFREKAGTQHSLLGGAEVQALKLSDFPKSPSFRNFYLQKKAKTCIRTKVN